MNDGVMDDIFWIPGTRMPWFNPWLGPEKIKKDSSYISIIYLICNILYISYMHIIYLIYCIYL